MIQIPFILGIPLFLAFASLFVGRRAACFVKAFGITFLAMPRSNHAKEAKEVSFSMKFGMFLLSALVFVFGLGAALVVKLLSKAAAFALDGDPAVMTLSINNLSTPMLALCIFVISVIAFVIYMMFRSKPVIYKTWDCGYYRLDSRNEYTATAFSKPFRIAFSFFLRPYRKTQKIRDSFYHVKSFTYETHVTQIFRHFLYDRVLAIVLRTAKSMRRMQPGSIHLYLAYIFAIVLLLIIFMNKI